MNNINLIGNLTRDVELKTLSTGAKVAKFSIAVNRRRKNTNGQYEYETCFIEVETWGRTAEVASEYLKKGSKVGVSGYLKQESWKDSNGNNRTKHIVALEKLDFLSAKENPQPQTPQYIPPPPMQEPTIEFVDDEIPF